MTDTAHAEADPPPIPVAIGFADIRAALGEGWSDFRTAPTFGLFFSLFYVVGGLIIYLQLTVLEQSWWILPVAVGFPLLGPFAAVGLYEVSRRLEKGQPLDWPGVIGVVFAQANRQIPSMAVVVVMLFLFWIYAAHLIFALFLGLSAMTNVMTSYEVLWTTNGLIMLTVGAAVGAALSTILYSITVIGLPLILDREIDLVTAMIASVRTVALNPGPMLAWGAMTAILLFLAMTPLFLGLFVVLPLLGHGTWRLYRRAVRFEDS